MAELNGKMAVTFDIKPLVTLPLDEYKELKKKEMIADTLIKMVLESNRELIRKMKEVLK